MTAELDGAWLNPSLCDRVPDEVRRQPGQLARGNERKGPSPPRTHRAERIRQGCSGIDACQLSGNLMWESRDRAVGISVPARRRLGAAGGEPKARARRFAPVKGTGYPYSMPSEGGTI
jgi:hypothetical protein